MLNVRPQSVSLQDEDYQTFRIPISDFEMHNYIMSKRGWQLKTSFRVENNSTIQCTYKKSEFTGGFE